MKLKDLDGGVHVIEDIAKKLRNSYLYASIDGATAKVVGIRDIGPHSIWLYDDDGLNSNYYEHKLDKFDVISFRPMPGLYNFPHMKRPLMLSNLPQRQWRIGWCRDNTVLSSVKGQQYTVEHFRPKDLMCCYEPVYPTLEEAVVMLKGGGHGVHIAISNTISVLRNGVNKYTLLKNFTPFLVWNNKMVFKVKNCSDLLLKDFNAYEQIIKQAI